MNTWGTKPSGMREGGGGSRQGSATAAAATVGGVGRRAGAAGRPRVAGAREHQSSIFVLAFLFNLSGSFIKPRKHETSTTWIKCSRTLVLRVSKTWLHSNQWQHLNYKTWSDI
jgi:hypothetical protein